MAKYSVACVYSYQICLNNNIIELMQQQSRLVILEEEKDSDPIFKVIFNKLKFLRGKLAAIDHIRTLDPKSLKTAQVNKLNKLPQIQKQMEKNQQFVRYYRSILVEHNLSNQKVDDLLKVSTLLTVGRRIHSDRYCPQEVRELYENIDKPIFGEDCDVSAGQISDEVVRVYHLLWEFLENDKYYSQCRDYMSYLEEIKHRKTIQGQNVEARIQRTLPPLSKVESLKQDLDLKLLREVNKKMEKMELRSEVFKIVFDSELVVKTIQNCHSESIFKIGQGGSEKYIDQKEDCSTADPSRNSQNKDMDRQPPDAITHPEIVWIQKSQSYEATDSYSVDKSDPNAVQHKKKRNRKGKKTTSTEIDNVRKISEAYTEPAPEKQVAKKVKYVEKKVG